MAPSPLHAEVVGPGGLQVRVLRLHHLQVPVRAPGHGTEGGGGVWLFKLQY